MLFGILLVAAIAMTAVSAFAKKAWLAFMTAGLWIVFAVHSYTESTMPATGVWDIYYATFFLGAFFTMVCFFIPLTWRDTKKEDTAGDISDVDRTEKENEDLWRQTRAPQIGRSAARRHQGE